MRKPIIAGNWKMYKTINQAIELAQGLKRELFALDAQNIDIVLCPPFTALCAVCDIIADSGMQLGGQDVYWQEEGAFTGEISALMLRDAGCRFVIIGHSERRQYFSETNETVNNKIKAALRNGLMPIVCVGETLDERKSGRAMEILDGHVQNSLKDIGNQEMANMVIAYEPVWAIGTGLTATPQQAQEAQKYIRDLLTKMYNKDIAGSIRIQYGGSVKPENIAELMAQPDIDGVLVGGSSLTVESFLQIIKGASQIAK